LVRGDLSSTSRSWTVVLPVQHAERGKSRLVGPDHLPRAELARAIALDSIAAVLDSASVRRVVVVTADPVVSASVHARDGGGPDVELLVDPGLGLSAAVQAGADRAIELQDDASVAVLLADVPAMQGVDLTAALGAAGQHPTALVPDWDGTGTVLLTAGPFTVLRHAFGPGSAERHHELGAVRLDLDLPRLRRDVDTAADLAAALALGVGPATGALLPDTWH
jgi:2-phospho-L-lactate guanylyltransferase